MDRAIQSAETASLQTPIMSPRLHHTPCHRSDGDGSALPFPRRPARLCAPPVPDLNDGEHTSDAASWISHCPAWHGRHPNLFVAAFMDHLQYVLSDVWKYVRDAVLKSICRQAVA